MKRLIFQVSVGERRPCYGFCIDSAAAYCARHGIDHEVLTEPVLKIAPHDSARSENALRLGYLPIYEKENAFSRLETYDEVAIIDADVWLRPTAPNIFEELGSEAAFAGVMEQDAPITNKYRQKINAYSIGQYGSIAGECGMREAKGEGYWFFNMGVMVLTQEALAYLDGETPEQFIRRPEFERFVNGRGSWKWSTDQTLLNYWLRKDKVPRQMLKWTWNALYGGVRPEKLREAHFVHFFLSDHLPRKGAEVPELAALIDAGATSFPPNKWY